MGPAISLLLPSSLRQARTEPSAGTAPPGVPHRLAPPPSKSAAPRPPSLPQLPPQPLLTELRLPPDRNCAAHLPPLLPPPSQVRAHVASPFHPPSAPTNTWDRIQVIPTCFYAPPPWKSLSDRPDLRASQQNAPLIGQIPAIKCRPPHLTSPRMGKGVADDVH